ncbi:MAG: pyridoxamine 5'-phosphate oxidase [Ignavibacteria bacterium]|nr:pyridoxamine 5'-phosphate oxidase [Ignavibacteria bacterium]
METSRPLVNIRRNYGKFKISEKTIAKNPFEQFTLWFDDAVNDNTILDPNAMTLATATKVGKPSSRTVLLKKYDNNGFVFFTNYESRKGCEIEENPMGSLLFFWPSLERQIRVDGSIERISQKESDEYFQTRDYKSRIGAWASRQSRKLKGRLTLMREVAGYIAKYPINVPLPHHWGGYRLIAEEFEFWQGRESRLHDRFLFVKENGNWELQRLYP